MAADIPRHAVIFGTTRQAQGIIYRTLRESRYHITFIQYKDNEQLRTDIRDWQPEVSFLVFLGPRYTNARMNEIPIVDAVARASVIVFHGQLPSVVDQYRRIIISAMRQKHAQGLTASNPLPVTIVGCETDLGLVEQTFRHLKQAARQYLDPLHAQPLLLCTGVIDSIEYCVDAEDGVLGQVVDQGGRFLIKKENFDCAVPQGLRGVQWVDDVHRHNEYRNYVVLFPHLCYWLYEWYREAHLDQDIEFLNFDLLSRIFSGFLSDTHRHPAVELAMYRTQVTERWGAIQSIDYINPSDQIPYWPWPLLCPDSPIILAFCHYHSYLDPSADVLKDISVVIQAILYYDTGAMTFGQDSPAADYLRSGDAVALCEEVFLSGPRGNLHPAWKQAVALCGKLIRQHDAVVIL